MARSLLLAAVALTAGFLVPAGASATDCPGDLDGDGSVSIAEVITVVRSSLEGCALPGPRFVDNQDGTVTDNQTGLMWEKKVDGSGCLHCAGDWYLWDQAAGEWLSRVNGAVAGRDTSPEPQDGLGGYSDWRLPSIAEWQTILVACNSSEDCLPAAFGPQGTWNFTNAVHETDSDAVWIADFKFGTIELQRGSRHGDSVCNVRAVRTAR